jgi:hypothetical protein
MAYLQYERRKGLPRVCVADAGHCFRKGLSVERVNGGDWESRAIEGFTHGNMSGYALGRVLGTT